MYTIIYILYTSHNKLLPACFKRVSPNCLIILHFVNNKNTHIIEKTFHVQHLTHVFLYLLTHKKSHFVFF